MSSTAPFVATTSHSNFILTTYSSSSSPLFITTSTTYPTNTYSTSSYSTTAYSTSTYSTSYTNASSSYAPTTTTPSSPYNASSQYITSSTYNTSATTTLKREDALQQFETGRIKHLQEERLHIQKKTFTKWINSFLNKARLEVMDLFTDLSDGKMLLKLLEIISGEKLGKPNNGRMRVHKVENVNKSLAFLHTKVRLESIGAEDIVDGNPRLILGLIWTIILRFHIQEIEINLDEENESSEKKSAKDALLLWCQRKTAGYKGVNIVDFTSSWRNGMGFNALIHAHRSDLVNYNALDTRSHIDNLNNAFKIAHEDLGIARILDAEDVDTNKPDEKSIITYVASYYHTFARMRDEMKGSRRIANIMNQMKDVDDSKARFERITTTLLEWIRKKIIELNDRNFPNSLDGVQKLLIEFKTYRTEEKPPKYMECSEIEALFFSINASLKTLNQPTYIPKDGQMIKDIEREWQKLVKAEHRREVALREELMRQERLEHLAFKFDKKSVLRKGYLEEMIQVLSDPRYGSNLAQVDATVKKHEAISADILARQERFEDLTRMSDELVEENYHGKERIKQKEEAILAKWKSLLSLLEGHKLSLQQASLLMTMLREADTILDTMKELVVNFRSDDVGGFLLAVEDLIQKHSLMESQMNSIGEAIKRLNKQGNSFILSSGKHKDIPLLERKLKELNQEHEDLVGLAQKRKARLEEARSFYQFDVDVKEEEAWVVEKQRVCQAGITAKDLRSVMTLQQKHKALEDEMQARRPKSENVIRIGEDLCNRNHPETASIREDVASLGQSWKLLEKLSAQRKKHLADAAEAYSFVSDANEAESWIKEKIPLAESTDFGEDELSAQALLQLNTRMQDEIKVYDGEIKSLNDLGQKLVANGITSLNLTSPNEGLAAEVAAPSEIEYYEELVPQEYWDEVVSDKVDEEIVAEEKMMTVVKSKYAFDGQGMIMAKGEEMFLLNKTNNDWWNVRKMTGEEGFVPANYVKEIAPRPVKVKVKKVKKIPVVQKVKRTRMVRVRKERPKIPTPSARQRSSKESETVEKRLHSINAAFGELKRLAELRTKLLNDSIKLLAFNRECLGFDQWMREKEKLLHTDEPSENVEASKRKFEQFLTDMSAANKRVENIDKMAEELATTGHSQMEKVRARQKQIHDQWDHLNRLKQRKERSLEGASSVELFHRTCDEARDWMVEKMKKLDTDELGRDLKTIQALQRKHDQLERELAPIEDKVNNVKTLANSVRISYPHERKVVDQRQEEIFDLWQKLKGKALDRRNRLEEAVGSEIFLYSAKNLLNWVGDVKQALNADEAARDVSTAEKLLESHNELGDDIRAHQDEFREIGDLGHSLVKRNPTLEGVHDKLASLAAEEAAINRGWQEKGDWLRQCLDLQLFNREADHIDAATSSHETFLDFADLGGTLDDVEALLKRHDDFENTLIAQDERLKTFSEMAHKLIAAHHYDANAIDERRNAVLARRKSVKAKAHERRARLNGSLAYQQFQADAEDFAKWMAEKGKTADDESYKDLSNLERKLQKHEAFERELRANEGQLRRLNRTGEDLIGMKHYRTEEIKATLEDLNAKWKALISKTQDRSRKLRQASDQLNFNKDLEDAAKSLDNFENVLRKEDVGTDVRSCKDLLNKQRAVESEMLALKSKINDAHVNGQQMVQNGHFDADNILKGCNSLKKRFDKLEGPSNKRRVALEESLRFHEFGFRVEAERQWIAEHTPAASSEVLGQTLHEAQNLMKKHVKLEAEVSGHKPQIEKTLNQGAQLIQEKHPEKVKIEALCQDLEKSWEELNAFALNRRKQLELNLKAQNYFFEANEVESWMNEKRNLLQTKDYGKDEDVARKKLAKHKALELEIDTYAGLVKEMGATAEGMIKNNHPQSRMLKEKQQFITHDLLDLQKLSTNLRQKLMESMYRHEYFREAEELEKWIAEQMLTASSDDYGQDYEHLLVLQAKFDDFKHRVEAGSERFNQCEELAKKLVASDTPYAAEIDKKKDHLGNYIDPAAEVIRYHKKVRAVWVHLLDVIRVRDEKLEAAGEIHRFNRDVAEALSRIQEKFKSMPDDLGRDVNSVQSLIRKHEGFENDLVALEAQLQVLVDDAAQLQLKYPGSNTEHITEQQSLVVENWNSLQEKAIQRRTALQEAEKLQKFLADSRDLMSWSHDLRSTMKAHEKVRDAASAQALKGEHERIKAEIEAREDIFQKVVDKGQSMIEENSNAAKEIHDRVKKVLEERNQLHAAWQNKKVYLDQLIDLQFFLRDVKQLDSLCIAQEASLSSSECGETVEEVDALLKKHLAFENVVEAQEEKLEVLKLHGAKLIEQNHFYSPNIKTHIDDVADRRAKVKSAAASRKQQLEDAQLYTQFIREVADANVWVDDKWSFLEAEKQKGAVTSFEDKIKKLQKHQAFMAEIQAHETRIKKILDKGNLLISRQYHSPQVKDQVRDLDRSWNRLVSDAQAHFRGLEEAQDILEFNTQVEKVEAWIRDKELLVQAGDLGKDYEHCLALQRKLEDVDSDMRVDDARFVKLNKLADKIISQGRGNNKAVQYRKEELNHKWNALKGTIDKYRQDLSGALEIHAFTRDVDDTRERIAEKFGMLTTEESGRDLLQVETLQRKQESILRDMTAIEKKIAEHRRMADVLCQRYVQKIEEIQRKLAEVDEEWMRLRNASALRQKMLSSSYTLHKFQADLKELKKWEEDVITRMKAIPLPLTTAEAEIRLQEHQETKAEIDGRKGVFSSLQKFGEKLLRENVENEETVRQNLQRLEEIKANVNESWEDRHKILSQAHQLRLFVEKVEAVESWLASKEVFLFNDDLGDSIASVDSLIRKHENFQKTLEAQGHKIAELEDTAAVLLNQNHYDSEGIKEKLQMVITKRDNLNKATHLRDIKLRESKSLQQFLRNIYEVEGWISEKMQVASDECYRDPTNLQSKIQKHGAFEAELTANAGRITAVTQEGNDLIESGHYAQKEIRLEVKRLQDIWKQLQDTSLLKRERLNEAYQALLFNRTLDDLDSWMDDIETHLQSEDHGRDLASVQSLLMKHEGLEADIAAHQSDVDQAQEVSQTFVNGNHFMSDSILQRVQAIVKRYNSLHEPVQIRHDNLNDSLLLHQLLRDVEDELAWLTEKEPQAFSQDLGSSLMQVQKLQKKHQVLEAEIQSHEPVISSLNGRAQQLIRSGHFAVPLIDEKMKELLSKLNNIKDAASVRRLRLLDAIESQMFFSEANEADAWIKEKTPFLTSTDVGKDEDSVVALLKKLENLGRDLANFQTVIDKLESLSNKLISRGHFDAENVTSKMEGVRREYETLHLLKEKRLKRLQESSLLYQFIRECDAVMEWLSEQTSIAASEDYGQDVEHVEVLIQKFESFMSSLNANADKAEKVKQEAAKLLEAKHPEPDRINEKVSEVLQLWEDLLELASARQEALAGAKQVHVFDRNAEETKTWIAEKVAIVSSEDYGHDLETIQGLARRHQGFERDLAAVREQVESVVEEAKRLAELFPDAKEHISVKHEETVEAWNDLLEKSAQRKDKLQQAEELQTYFDEYRELIAWLNEILAKITAPELPKDVSGAETLMNRHKEYKMEMDARMDSLEKFSVSGNSLVAQGHFMSEEIADRISTLEHKKRTVLECWEARRNIYQQNLDLRVFLRDAQMIETWIDTRETVVKDEHLGESIAEVEELIRRHDDFLQMIDVQEDKLDPIKRFTMIEEQYAAQKKKEEDARRAEAQRKEQERMEELKRREVLRITDARRREDERRRTQEIKFSKEDGDPTRMTMNSSSGNLAVRDDHDASSNGSSSYYSGEEDFESGHGAEATQRETSTADRESPSPRPGSQASPSSLKRGNSLRQELFRHTFYSTNSGDLKRAESMKMDSKKPKRTPSFTTRRRTQSFRKHKRMENLDNLPPVEIQGYLERKQELQTGGKKATIRSWKLFYTVLCGQLLCFFKDDDDFYDQKAASPPVSIFQARVEKAEDYTKKKNVFRLITRDGAEYLLLASSETHLEEWVSKLTFHAQLPPSMQLMPYDNHKEGPAVADSVSSNVAHQLPSRDSSDSSSNSTPEIRHHRHAISSHPQGSTFGVGVGQPTRQTPSQALDNPLYANLRSVGERTKPPVPPRGSESSSTRSSQHYTHTSDEGPIYQNRVSVVPSHEEPWRENIYQNFPSRNRRMSAENIGMEEVPPLPASAPPSKGVLRPPVAPARGVTYNQQTWEYQQAPPHSQSVNHHHQSQQYYHHPPPHYPPPQHHFSQVSSASYHHYTKGSRNSDSADGVPGSRQPYSDHARSSMSLPPGASLPSHHRQTSSAHPADPVPPPGATTQHRHSSGAVLDRNESSSEGDGPNMGHSNGKEKKKSSVFKFLSRRKGAQV